MIINTREIASDYRLSHWSGVINRQSESGLSIKNYCEREGFHENCFYYWRKKLREAACEQMLEAKTGTYQVNTIKQRFTELITTNTSNLSHNDDYRRGSIRINIAGIVITADHEYPAGHLKELLKGMV